MHILRLDIQLRQHGFSLLDNALNGVPNHAVKAHPRQGSGEVNALPQGLALDGNVLGERQQVLAWGGDIQTGVRKKKFIFQLDMKMSARASACLGGHSNWR